MIKLKNLLLESNTIYKVEVLIRTSAEENQVFIYNEIRGLPDVVVVAVEQNQYLIDKGTDKMQFALLKVKFLAPAEPKEAIENIKKDALITRKVPGLYSFIIRYNTLEKLGQY